MAIVIKSKKGDSNNDIIKKFKKATINNDVVQQLRDRRFYQKPSKIKSIKTAEKNRLKKRLRSLKKQKNVSPQVINKLVQRLGSY